MVNQIYPPELQLNKANISDTEAPFLDLHLKDLVVFRYLKQKVSVSNGFVSSKIYDKRDDFDFDIVNFPVFDGDVPRRASYGVHTFLNLLGLLESAIMLQTSTLEINVQRPNFSNRAIGIINFEKPFLNFILDTMN